MSRGFKQFIVKIFDIVKKKYFSNTTNSFIQELKNSKKPIFATHNHKTIFVSNGLQDLLDKNNFPTLNSEEEYFILSSQIFVKNDLCTINQTSFFCLTPLSININSPYILLKDNNVISFNVLNNSNKLELAKPNTTLSNILSAKSLDNLDHSSYSNTEIVFKNKKDNIFIVYNSTKIKNLLCLHLFDITQYKSMEANLAHSQKMQAIGQLAGGISHDFNNLLTAILGFCDLLLIKHPAGDPSFNEIMQIKQNSNRAANLVRQLLALSRKQVLKPKILDISDVLSELANLVRRLIGENIDLDIVHGSDLKPVKVDQGQLEQVIINLVVNARDAIFKHTSVKGKISIATSNITIRQASDVEKHFSCPEGETITPGEYVLISVQDNGIGIPKNVVKKIFEPFFSTKAIGAGTGLGLSTVYSIIKQTNGNLYLSSKENHGSIFNVYLKAENHEISSKDINADTQLITKDLTGYATILLVEDEIPVRMFCTHALKNKGYNIIEAENGEEALKIFRNTQSKIDLIISDVIMPGINGPKLIYEIRKTSPDIKVIFISGYAEEAFSDEISVRKDFHFLSKPFTLNELATQVKEVLSLEID